MFGPPKEGEVGKIILRKRRKRWVSLANDSPRKRIRCANARRNNRGGNEKKEEC